MARKTIYDDYTTWKGGSAKDKIYIGEGIEGVSVNTGGGNDSIYNDGWFSTIYAGSGNDTIVDDAGYHSSIYAGSGNDEIHVYEDSEYATVRGGIGNDTVYGYGYNMLYRYASGDGNDVIYGFDSDSTIKITGGKYTRSTVGNDVILTVGSGKITLVGAADVALNIKGTLAGGKSIDNTKNKKKLSGTSYADTITNSGAKVTINGGKGNDKIHNQYGNNSSIVAGDGNDSIYNRSFYTTISGGAGKDSVENYNGAWALINTGDDNDSIHNINTYDDDGHYVTINAGAGNDKISNEYGNYVSINAGTGNDSIYNRSYCTTIFGGNGADTITNFNSAQTSINGGAGNDFISNEGDVDYASVNTTIKGGTGNDSISLSGAVSNTIIQYAAGDGKDKIYGFGETDTLKITGGKYTKKTSGSNVIITVGSGKITLVGAKGKTLHIDGTLDGKLSIPSSALQYNGHSYYIFNNKSTWEAAKTYCESRGGHLAVINDDAENSTLFNYMKNNGHDSAYFGLSDAANEGTWTWATGDEVGYTNWTSDEPNGGTYENYAMFYWKFTNGTWNDGDFNDSGTDNGGRAFICEWDTVTTSGGTSTVTIPPDTVPSGDLLEGTSGHDNLSNGNSLNQSKDAGKVIYAYSGNDTVTNYANNVYIIGGAGNDYIKSNYGSNSTVHGDAGADNITVKSNNAFVYGDDDNDNILTYNEGNFVYGGNGDDYIRTENNNNGFVSGDAGDDTISAYKGNHLTLSGGAGNDSLWGGSGSDTLIGGSGNDIFVYRPDQGTDHIMDFSGGDMLKILKTNGNEGGTFTSATFSGGNLTLEISGGGTVILDNVSAGDNININGTMHTIKGNTLD